MLLVGAVRDRRRRLDPAVHGGAGRARARSRPTRISSAIYDGLDFTSARGFLIFLGLGTFLMTMIGIVMHILSLYTITRFTNECSYMLSTPAARAAT